MLQRRGDVVAFDREPWRGIGHLGEEQLQPAAGGRRQLVQQHLVQGGGPTVDVRSGIDRGTEPLLRAHVRRGSDGDTGVGELGRSALRVGGRGLGDAEIGDQGVAVFGEEDVLRLDVAVDHALLVGKLQRLRRFAGDADGFGDRE
ncbi:MAG TPA: hypothetical protein VLD58_16020, partial [Gemmatimonadales bacterium]|nr:hypothetical protein [Gemmatimonadales bacterium]